MSLPYVYILTWCQRIEQLYGTTLVFHTLREGFPNCLIHVADAASIPEARTEIRRAVACCQAEFLEYSRPMQLWEFMERCLNHQRHGSAVFIDPDVCFWGAIENWQFTGLAAGRLIPRHQCDIVGCLTEPRLHPSLLWFPDVARTLATIARINRSKWYFRPFCSEMVYVDQQWRFFDVAAGLYSVCKSEMQSFDDNQLNAYDHLFAGTYADTVIATAGTRLPEAYQNIHRAAQVDYRQIKGCWRAQDEYFRARSVWPQSSPSNS